MYKCIVFDVDGTLIDTEKAIIYSLQKLLIEEINKEYSYEELIFALGIPSDAALTHLGVSNLESANVKWGKYMKEFNNYINVYEGIGEMLKTLSTIGVKTGVVTSRTNEELIGDFNNFKLSDYFMYVVCADDTKNHKPHPEPILKFIEISKLNVKDIIYIGDTVYDKQCAEMAGVDFGLAKWGTVNTQDINAKYILNGPQNVIDLIKVN